MNQPNFLPPLKVFEQDFLNKDGSVLFSIRYKQSTLGEYIEFHAMDDTQKSAYIKKELLPQFPLTWWEKIIKFFFRWYIQKSFRLCVHDDFILSVVENKFRTPESIFKKVERFQKKSKRKSTPQITLKAIWDTYGLSPKDILSLTLEQYIWLQDGIVFIGNEQDKEGRFINDRALVDDDEVQRKLNLLKNNIG